MIDIDKKEYLAYMDSIIDRNIRVISAFFKAYIKKPHSAVGQNIHEMLDKISECQAMRAVAEAAPKEDLHFFINPYDTSVNRAFKSISAIDNRVQEYINKEDSKNEKETYFG